MDFLVEIIMGLLFEVPFEAAMESKKLKNGVKTAIFGALCGAVTAFFAFLAVDAWLGGDETSGFFMTRITIGMLIVTIFGAIRGHKRKWKNS